VQGTASKLISVRWSAGNTNTNNDAVALESFALITKSTSYLRSVMSFDIKGGGLFTVSAAGHSRRPPRIISRVK